MQSVKGRAIKALVIVKKLVIVAGKANPAPPIGTALGPTGVNMMEFCKAFNEKSAPLAAGGKAVPCPTTIVITPDKKFTFTIKKPPVSYLIKEAISLESGSKEPGRLPVAKITSAQVEQIAKFKMEDMNCVSLVAAMQMIIGSARSMGVEFVEA